MKGHGCTVLVLAGLLLLPLSLDANPVIVNWVAYSPSEPWQPGQVIDDSLVRLDLEILARHGFQGLVTYGTLDSLWVVPRLARSVGFQYVVMGVWIDADTAANRQGIRRLIEHHQYADAICVGNEALFFNRVDTSYLKWAIDTVRAATGKPVTTSEHWTKYLAPGYAAWLQRNSDFLFPIVNPTDNGITHPDSGVAWVIRTYERITAAAGDSMEVLIKEAGWPTWSDSAQQRVWANEDNQCHFFQRLSFWQRDTMKYFCFEAFDQWWKNWDPTQRYWGLFDSGRRPKLYAYTLGVKESGSSMGQTSTGALLRFSQNDLYDITGSRRSAQLVRPGVYFLKLASGRFRKVLVVR
ncbi:MAG: glycosyl hydrolase family 17 protein [candidate division WOR-3 bacterium]